MLLLKTDTATNQQRKTCRKQSTYVLLLKGGAQRYLATILYQQYPMIANSPSQQNGRQAKCCMNPRAASSPALSACSHLLVNMCQAPALVLRMMDKKRNRLA